MADDERNGLIGPLRRGTSVGYLADPRVEGSAEALAKALWEEIEAAKEGSSRTPTRRPDARD
jgi:hypothetical protein